MKVTISDLTLGRQLSEFTSTVVDFAIPVDLGTTGNHLIQVRVSDAAGNYADSSLAVFLDPTPLLIERIDGLPSLRTNTVLDTIDITFSKAITASSFTLADLTLTRNGGSNILAGAVALSPISDRTFRVTGLSGLTAIVGLYEFTIRADGVTDLVGVGGSGTSVSNWVYSVRLQNPHALSIEDSTSGHRDVNDNGSIEPLDVLSIINFLNEHTGSLLVNDIIDDSVYYNVNGDAYVDALDVLVVINHLNGNISNRTSTDATNLPPKQPAINKVANSSLSGEGEAPIQSRGPSATAAPMELFSQQMMGTTVDLKVKESKIDFREQLFELKDTSLQMASIDQIMADGFESNRKTSEVKKPLRLQATNASELDLDLEFGQLEFEFERDFA